MIRKEEIRKYRKEAAKALPLFTVFRERMEKNATKYEHKPAEYSIFIGLRMVADKLIVVLHNFNAIVRPMADGDYASEADLDWEIGWFNRTRKCSEFEELCMQFGPEHLIPKEDIDRIHIWLDALSRDKKDDQYFGH